MEWLNREIFTLPRKGNFPYKVKLVYFSHGQKKFDQWKPTPADTFETAIRLKPDEGRCCDILNGVQVDVPFPNVAWKKPGGLNCYYLDSPRTAVSFGYPSQYIEDFKELGIYPEQNCQQLYLTPEIKRLVERFRELCFQLYTPGAADEIDWVCFRLLRELVFSGAKPSPAADETEIIKNISLWFQTHYMESFNLEEIAQRYGLSRAVFFKKWRSVFNVTPIQYILDLRIKAAENFLRETDFSVNHIIDEVNFSSPYAFYRRFYDKYRMTPDQYRQSVQKQNGSQPEVMPKKSGSTV